MTGPINRMQRAMLGLTTLSGTSGARMQRSLQDISTRSMEVAGNAAMIGAATLLPLGLATHAAMKFEKEMTNVATLMDTSKEKVSEFSDAVLAMASRTPVPLSDLTESLYQIRSEGYKGAEALDILKQSAQLSVAGLSTATEAAKSVASAMRVFADEGITATQISDLFFKTVAVGRTKMSAINESFGETAALIHSAGTSMREMMAATAALTNSGMTASSAMISLQGATTALVKPQGEMEKVFAALGVRSGPQLIKMMGGLVPAMKAVGETAARTGLNVNDAFGRVQGLRAYTLLTGPLADQFELDMKRMGNGINEVNEAYAKQLGTTSAQTEIAKNNLIILGVTLGSLLLPAITALTRAVTPVIQGVTTFAREHKTLTKVILYGVTAFGVFAAAVGVGAFVVGTITKAVWLWSIATKIATVAQAFLATVTGTLTGELIATRAGMIGATAAAHIMKLGLLGLMATVSMATAGLVLLVGLFTEADDVSDSLSSKLQTTEDGFHKVAAATKAATLGMEAYNAEVDKYNARKKQHDRFQLGFGDGTAKQFFSREVTPGMVLSEIKYMMNPDAPKIDNYFNGPKQVEEARREWQQQQQAAPVINLNVHVDKNGNVTTTGDQNGRIPIKTTGGFR